MVEHSTVTGELLKGSSPSSGAIDIDASSRSVFFLLIEEVDTDSGSAQVLYNDYRAVSLKWIVLDVSFHRLAKSRHKKSTKHALSV